MSKTENADGMFDLACFLANSARGSLEEGVLSASLRLIDAVARLPSVCTDSGRKRDEFLEEMSRFISQNMTQDFLVSREKYVAFLDQIVSRFGKEVAKRNGLQ